MKLKGSCHCKAVQFTVESHTPYPFLYCYCSICRKTAGGGGYAINIMGDAKTLKVKGKKYISVYRAKLSSGVKHKLEKSSCRRHFCSRCASALWIWDPNWPELVHPFASAIDSPLPIPPEYIHSMLDFAANWCVIPRGKKHKYFAEYSDESIEEWHKRHKLYST